MTSLDRLLRACRAPLVAFSVELGTEAWRLQRTGRVAHGAAYVAERALAAGFEASQVDGILRYERGRGVQGSIFLLQKGRVKVLVAVGPAGGPSDGSGGRGGGLLLSFSMAQVRRTVCKFWQQGKCNQASGQCTWAHGEWELGTIAPCGASGPRTSSGGAWT